MYIGQLQLLVNMCLWFSFIYLYLHIRHMINFLNTLESTLMFAKSNFRNAAVVRTEDLSWNKQERPLRVMLSDMLWCVSFIDTTYLVLPCKLRFLCKSDDKIKENYNFLSMVPNPYYHMCSLLQPLVQLPLSTPSPCLAPHQSIT